MDPITVIILVIISIMAIMALLAGRNPVVTEFEARQRGMTVAKESREELEMRRRRSDDTTRTALQVFIALAIVLLVCALAIYFLAPELTIFTVPIFVAIGVLFLFVMMWMDEENIKAHYEHIRIER